MSRMHNCKLTFDSMTKRPLFFTNLLDLELLNFLFSDLLSLNLIYSSNLLSQHVEVEPQLQPLNNEQFNLRSMVPRQEARLDMKAVVSRNYSIV